MHADHGETKKELAHEIPIAHAVDAVLAHARKTEFARDTFAIKDNCRPSERAGTERENICSNKTIIETFSVAFKCLDLSQ